MRTAEQLARLGTSGKILNALATEPGLRATTLHAPLDAAHRHALSETDAGGASALSSAADDTLVIALAAALAVATIGIAIVTRFRPRPLGTGH